MSREDYDDPTGQDSDYEEGITEDSYKVVSPTQARTSKDVHARTVQTDPEMTEDSDEDDSDGDEETSNAGACPHCGNTRDNTSMGDTAMCSRCGENYEIDTIADPEDPTTGLAEDLPDTPSAELSDTPSAEPVKIPAKRGRKKKESDEDPLVDGEECPYCSNRLGNTMMDVSTGKYTCHRCAETFLPGETPPEDIEPEVDEPSPEDLEKAEKPDTDFIHGIKYDDEDEISEAGGGTVQHRSFRTEKDNPQHKDARWSNEVDEGAAKQKESETVKKIRKSQKTKKSIKVDQLKHQTPRSTKSGVHKKDK